MCAGDVLCEGKGKLLVVLCIDEESNVVDPGEEPWW